MADPDQCGVIVRKHVTGLTITLYVFILLALLAALGAIYLYARR